MLLPTRKVEKPWGRDALPAAFGTTNGQQIGEIWFQPPVQMAGLLVKYIFTGQKLSVQVHPNDAQTQAAGLGRQGKEECWLVLDAQPGATLGIGFDETLDPAAMRAAALDGTIEQLLSWHEVKRGDFFYIPANTVHAIGAGITLIEVQQNSDITYRLYDYGRPRELHLDEAIAVASGAPYPVKLRTTASGSQKQRLVDGPYFTLDLVNGAADADLQNAHTGPLLVIPLEGSAHISGQVVEAGQCGLAPNLAAVTLAPGGQCLLASA